MSTASKPSTLRWPVIVLAGIGLVVAAPFILALLGIGLALTIGLAVLAAKLAVVALVIWAVVSLFRALFGSSHAASPSPKPRVASELAPDEELERERRESLAALDRELELAVARQQGA